MTNSLASMTTEQAKAIIDHAANQGPGWWLAVIAGLCIAGFVMVFLWMRRDNQTLVAKLGQTHEDQLKEYRTNGERMISVIAENSQAFRELKEELRERRKFEA